MANGTFGELLVGEGDPFEFKCRGKSNRKMSLRWSWTPDYDYALKKRGKLLN